MTVHLRNLLDNNKRYYFGLIGSNIPDLVDERDI